MDLPTDELVEESAMNRRTFLKYSMAAGALIAAPIALQLARSQNLPVIVGDGIHDDFDGIVAAIQGKDFVAVNGCVTMVGSAVYLAAGRYRMVGKLPRLKKMLIGAGPSKTTLAFEEKP